MSTRGKKPVERLTEEQERLQSGFIARAKAERFRFEETTKSDYYFCVVFPHGSQAMEFLRAAGYRETDPQFVDGLILAQALGIEMPPSPFKLRKLRPADKSLRHLVTTIPRRSGFVEDADE